MVHFKKGGGNAHICLRSAVKKQEEEEEEGLSAYRSLSAESLVCFGGQHGKIRL